MEIARNLWVLGLFGTIGYYFRRIFRRENFAFTSVEGLRIAIRPGSHDKYVARSCLGGEFAPLKQYCDQRFSGLIVDAGGYIGTAALALHRDFPSATIVTIEPSLENFRLLVRNTLHVKEIYPIRAALGASEDQRLTLFNRHTGPWGYTVVSDPQDVTGAGNIEEVPTITLEQIGQMFGSEIGILKLDIEGGEHELFNSKRPSLEKIPAIFVELHDRIVPGCTSLFTEFSRERRVESFGGEKFLSADKTLPLLSDPQRL